MLIMRNPLLHSRIGLFSAIFLAMLLLGCTASPMHAADEAEKFAPVVPGGNLKEDVEATPCTPDFATVVVKGGGLWPQLHCAADGTLLALGYNAPGHTTLPGDVDCWASTDGGQTWAKRGTAAPRPDKDANYCACSKPAAIWAIPAPLNFPTAEWSPCFTRSNPAFTMATIWALSDGKHPRKRIEPTRSAPTKNAPQMTMNRRLGLYALLLLNFTAIHAVAAAATPEPEAVAGTRLRVDWRSLISGHNLELPKLPASHGESLRLGNGDIGVAVYAVPECVVLFVGKNDLLDYRTKPLAHFPEATGMSNAGVSMPTTKPAGWIRFRNATPRNPDAKARLDIWNAEVSTHPANQQTPELQTFASRGKVNDNTSTDHDPGSQPPNCAAMPGRGSHRSPPAHAFRNRSIAVCRCDLTR